MNVHSVAGFFAMGGYAHFVWPAYAVFFIVLMADTLAPRLRRRRLLRELRTRMSRQAARQDRAATRTGASAHSRTTPGTP